MLAFYLMYNCADIGDRVRLQYSNNLILFCSKAPIRQRWQR